MSKREKMICPTCRQDMHQLPRSGKPDCPQCGQTIPRNRIKSSLIRYKTIEKAVKENKGV